MMMQKLTPKQKLEIISKYKDLFLTCADLGREYGVKAQTINLMLSKNGIKIRNDKSDTIRKYKLNQSYFDIIDTEEKAYFLGLLYADGYNDEKRNRLFISLQEEDKEILEKFKVALDTDKPLEFKQLAKNDNELKNQYKLSICSKKISKSLSKLGCVQAKSLILQFPTEEQVPKELQRHFIRGYFDGDGSFSVYLDNRGYKAYQANISSSIYFSTYIKNFLKDNLAIHSCVSQRDKNKDSGKVAIFGRVQIYRFLDWLYSDSNIHLFRKYNKYLENKF